LKYKGSFYIIILKNRERSITMEEEKTAKKINIPVIVMIAAVVLIAAGAIMMVTGNNKNLLGNDKKEEPPKQEEPKQEEPKEEPKRNIPRELTIEEAKNILDEECNNNHSGEGWYVNSVLSVLTGDNAYLVTYEEVAPDGVVTTKQTIILINDGTTSVELPGWLENERDVSEYHFGEQPVENPEVEQPMTDEQLDEVNVVTNDQLQEQTTE
jgi:hypothetical protein